MTTSNIDPRLAANMGCCMDWAKAESSKWKKPLNKSFDPKRGGSLYDVIDLVAIFGEHVDRAAAAKELLKIKKLTNGILGDRCTVAEFFANVLPRLGGSVANTIKRARFDEYTRNIGISPVHHPDVGEVYAIAELMSIFGMCPNRHSASDKWSRLKLNESRAASGDDMKQFVVYCPNKRSDYCKKDVFFESIIPKLRKSAPSQKRKADSETSQKREPADIKKFFIPQPKSPVKMIVTDVKKPEERIEFELERMRMQATLERQRVMGELDLKKLVLKVYKNDTDAIISVFNAIDGGDRKIIYSK